MEIMEEGNIIDRVRILLQRDQTFYNENQRVLQMNVCSTMVGGFLDFPIITTFVASKIVSWWEESYYLLFRTVSSIFQESITVNFSQNEDDDINICKSLTAKSFVNLISQSSTMLLEHLHTLSQEALDHADLSVLTGTIGTATLIRNTMWIYNQQLIKTKSDASLSQEVKTYQNMSEALAERLLDLHSRLISLYILQDVDCLNWNAEHAFSEGERSSSTIQMWWFYIQGIQEDLWNSMPPKTATRILSGILDESLTILTSRYMQVQCNKARSELVITDLSNILLCMFTLLPTICNDADEFLGRTVTTNIIRNIHVKCHLLFTYFLIRGTPLSMLYKNFKNGFSNTSCTNKKQNSSIEPWIIFAMSENNERLPINVINQNKLSDNLEMKYQLTVLLSKAQPVWPLLLKILKMNNCIMLYEIFYHVVVEMEESEYTINQEPCKGFLCNKDCLLVSNIQSCITNLLLIIGNKNDIENALMKVLEQVPEKWVIHFSHSQEFQSVSETLNAYIENMKVTANCLPDNVIIFCTLIEDNLPPDVIPLGNSVLIQLMAMSLYDELGTDSPVSEALCRYESQAPVQFQKDIEQLTTDLTANLSYTDYNEIGEIMMHYTITERSGRNALKVMYQYLKYHADWLQIKLGSSTETNKNKNLLHKMFYIGNRKYDQLLSGEWTPQWTTFLNMPLRLTSKDIQDQLSKRPEFWQNIKLTKHDQMVVQHLKSLSEAFK